MHPSTKELDDYGQGRLPRAEADRIALHLDSCTHCMRHMSNRPISGTAMPLSNTSAPFDAGTDTPPVLSRFDVPPPRQATPVFPQKIELSPPPAAPPQPKADVPATPRPATPPLANPEVPPEILTSSSKYEVIEKLGEGGMGTVWKARQTWLGRDVAIKILGGAALVHPEGRARFRLEMLASGRLDHPNIVKTYDAEQVGETLLLVMEFIDGISLEKLVRQRGQLPAGFAARCIAQAAAGLQYAHEQGLVHRDIKPANIMITRDKQAKVLDFGLARLAEVPNEDRRTRYQVFMGTAEFVSPEQAVNAREADIRSDIYSLGCTLYFLLAGNPPFSGGSAYEIAARQLTESPPPIPAVPPALWAVMMKMMAKRPDQRYQTPAEVVQALTNFLEGRPDSISVSIPPLPLPAYPSGKSTSISRLWRRQWPKIAIAALAGLVMAGVLVLVVRGMMKPAARREAPAEPPKIKLLKDDKNENEKKEEKKSEPGEEKVAAKPEKPKPEKPKPITPWVILFPEKLKMPNIEAATDPPQPPKEVKAREVQVVQDHILLEHGRPFDALLMFPKMFPNRADLLVVRFGTSTSDSTFWNWKTAKAHDTFTHRHKNQLLGMALSPDGERVVSWGGPAGQAGTWEVIVSTAFTKEEVARWPLGGKNTGPFSFSPDGKRIWNWPKMADEVRVWDLPSRTELPRLKPLDSGPNDKLPDVAKALSKSGAFAAIGLPDGRVRVWETVSGKTAFTIQAAKADIRDLEFSPDEKRLVSRGGKEMPRVWDRQTGKEVCSLAGAAGSVDRLTFTPDGRLLTSGPKKVIELWDASNGTKQARFEGHEGKIIALAVSPNEPFFASGSDDKTIRVWELPR